jgi:hypothetical protein
MMDRINRIKESFIPRKTEQTDTGDQIQRHTPDHNKRKSKQQDKNDSKNDDLTDISVESLIIFLQGLIKETETAPPPSKPIDPTMNKAMRAYGRAPTTTEKRYTYLDDDAEPIDIDRIHQLINKLKHLIDRKHNHITLEQGTGFVQSIEKTVEKYLAI